MLRRHVLFGVVTIALWTGVVALVFWASVSSAQTNLAGRLDRAIKAVPCAIAGVSIGDQADKTTWKVQPTSLQACAQPTIDAFDPNHPAHEAAELDAAVKGALDNDRLVSAILWAIGDTVSVPPTTKTAYRTLRTKVIEAYRTQPWK